MQNHRTCSFDGCHRKACKRGFCEGHYQQLKRGVELGPIRLLKAKGSCPRVTCDEVPCKVPGLIGPCHEKRGGKARGGYGKIDCSGRTTLAHRYIWEQMNGPIPEGMYIDHQCRNRACCNEDHLRVVTPLVNGTENVIGAAWQIQGAKTHCPKGHPYSEANTQRWRNGRTCRQCKREWMAAYRAIHPRRKKGATNGVAH